MNARRFRAILAAGAGALAALFAGGCASYRLGDGADLPFTALHVAPPVNASLAPQAAALLGADVAREIDRSGRTRIAAAGEADATLAITLTDLRREASADRADDTGLARKWRITLTAECTLKNPRTGQVWFERRSVSAFDEVYADSGLVPAEHQNMPVLTSRLAESIAREVLAVW